MTGVAPISRPLAKHATASSTSLSFCPRSIGCWADDSRAPIATDHAEARPVAGAAFILFRSCASPVHRTLLLHFIAKLQHALVEHLLGRSAICRPRAWSGSGSEPAGILPRTMITPGQVVRFWTRSWAELETNAARRSFHFLLVVLHDGDRTFPGLVVEKSLDQLDPFTRRRMPAFDPLSRLQVNTERRFDLAKIQVPAERSHR